MVKFTDGKSAIFLVNPSFPFKEQKRFEQTKTVTQTGRVFVYTRYEERIIELTWEYMGEEDYQKLKEWFERQEGQGKVWRFYPDANDDFTYYTVRFWQESIEFEKFMPNGYKGSIRLRVENFFTFHNAMTR